MTPFGCLVESGPLDRQVSTATGEVIAAGSARTPSFWISGWTRRFPIRVL